MGTLEPTSNNNHPFICQIRNVLKESDQQIAFLDTLVSRKDNTITIDVYRKGTHKDRYLDFSSHHDKRHKISTAETLLHRAIKLPSTPQGKSSRNQPLLCYFQYLIADIFQTTHTCHPFT